MEEQRKKDDLKRESGIRPLTLSLPVKEEMTEPVMPPRAKARPGIRPRQISLLAAEEELPVILPEAKPRPRIPKSHPVPLVYKSFAEAVEGCREKHPLPFELISSQTPSHATWLLSQLKQARTRPELEALADSLSYRDLSMLFSTLSNLKRRDETAQIQNLIRLRASHYLYLCGWLTLQHTYPRSSVSDPLADLCMILEDLRFVRDSERKSRRSLPLPSIPLGPWRVIWTRVPLISEIALPNSRHFITEIAREIYESKADLQGFFLEYAIYPGLPLADAIARRYEEMVSGISANPLLSQDFFDRFRK